MPDNRLKPIQDSPKDSPKCFTCLKDGKIGQTYKVAGKPSFKCHDCGKVYSRDEFSPMDFNWKNDPEAYKTWMRSRGVEYAVL